MNKWVIVLSLMGQTAFAEIAFEDRSGTLPLRHIYDGDWEHYVGGGVAIFDCNKDSYPDFVAAGGSNPARLFVNGAKNDITFELADFPSLNATTGAYPIDIDGDGILDLFVLRVGENRVLRGRGDCTFEDVTTTWGLTSGDQWSTAFSATWEDDSNWPTMAVGNYVDRSNPDGPFEACDANTLWRHSGGQYRANRLEPGFCSLSLLFSDWSRRNRADLRVSNDRHYYVRGGREQMWRMPEVNELGPEDGWNKISIWGMGIASRDITGDTRPDVVLTSMGDQLMHLSNETGFVAAPFSIGTYAHRPFIGDDGRPSTGWHAEFGDVNNDGLADLFIAKGNVDQMPGNAMKDPNNLLIQNKDGTFSETAADAGVASVARSRGAGLADFNLDGRLDVIVVNRRAPLEIFQNHSDGGNWLTVSPRQRGANGFAIGAWIELRIGEEIRTVERTIGGGHAGGQMLPIHFGLGLASEVEGRVLWPDGQIGEWQVLRSGQDHEIWKN